MSKHTPGQRVVKELWPDTVAFSTVYGVKSPIGLAEAIDDITAAPDLLEACEALLHLYETPGDMTNYEALAIQRDAIAAIAKAKGKED